MEKLSWLILFCLLYFIISFVRFLSTVLKEAKKFYLHWLIHLQLSNYYFYYHHNHYYALKLCYLKIMNCSKIIDQLINHNNLLISSWYLASDDLCNNEDNNKDFHKYKYKKLRRRGVSKIVIICSNFQVGLQAVTVSCLWHTEKGDQRK